jgi:excisionase family DNA binding protein
MENNRISVEQQDLIPAAELCRRLRMSRATLGRLVRAKRIGFYRVGGRLMFDERVLSEFKASAFHPPVEIPREAA